jgi:hypothetical protein
MTTESHDRHGPLSRIGYWFKRTATFLYGPADLPAEVDPIVSMDEEMGNDTDARPAPQRSERQRSYDELPRGTAE